MLAGDKRLSLRPGPQFRVIARLRSASSGLLTQLLSALFVATLVPLGLSFVQVQQDKAEAENRASQNAALGAHLAASQVVDLVDRARGAPTPSNRRPRSGLRRMRCATARSERSQSLSLM